MSAKGKGPGKVIKSGSPKEAVAVVAEQPKISKLKAANGGPGGEESMRKKGGQSSGRKPKPTGNPLGGPLGKGAPLPPGAPDTEGAVEVKRSAPQNKVDWYSAELLARKPLGGQARDALCRKCGKKQQDVGFTRNEAHRPSGVDDGKPSRHERVPPAAMVLMFNCVNSSFELTHGDIATLPDAETIDMRSLTSGMVLGRIKISPEKGTAIEERVEFPNEWRVGAEHGLMHDGLQSDGALEVRVDWRDQFSEPHVAMLKVNPWLAYGCGEGARLAIRKPGALEGTAATVQRTLRDDSVVVRRDGSVGEVTVDPTPFTVVLASNPRHQAGTRLLIVHDGASVDAQVDTWPESEIDIKEGSRHMMSVQGRLVSGWITMVTKDGVENLVQAPEAEWKDSAGNDGVPEPHYFLQTSKPLPMRAGCDPQNTEKVGSLSKSIAVRVLESRETEEYGTRAYVSSIPGSAVSLCAALNEFNHSVQRFPSVAEYEAARANYLEDIVTREALVEDAITGNNLRIKDQTLHVSTATEQQDNSRIPPEWNVKDVLDMVTLLLVPSPNRAMGLHPALPVLVRAGPGTGKTWMAKQAVFTLADRLLRGTGSNDGIRLVPIVVFVQRIIYLLREASASASGKQQSLLGRYIESMYSGKKYESWCEMLMQAYEMRALIVLLDGVDEAAGLRDQIDDFVHKDIVPSGNRVLVTSRPEGILLSSYIKTFVVMNLSQLTNEQQRRVINIQMEGNEFFDHLLSLGEVRKGLDDAYKKIGAVTRGDLEALWAPSGWIGDENVGEERAGEWNPLERQHDLSGQRIVAESHRALRSNYLKELDEQMRLERGKLERGKLSLLDRIDSAMAKLPPTEVGRDFAAHVLAETGGEGNEGDAPFSVALKLGAILQARKEEAAKLEATAGTKKKKEHKGGGGEGAEGKETKHDKAAEALWKTMTQRTDEIYAVAEHMQPVFEKVVAKLVTEVARDEQEAKALVADIEHVALKDPVRLYEKAHDEYAERFDDGEMPEACVPDVVRCRVALVTGASIVQLVRRLTAGIEMELAKPAVIRGDGSAPPPSAPGDEEKVDTVVHMMHLHNKFHELDPTHFRAAVAGLKVTYKNVSVYAEIEVHFAEILSFGTSDDARAYEHYNFFRKRLKGTVPEKELDLLLEEKLVFLVDATGIPVLLSLLVLIFTSGGEDLTKLPSNRIELYELGIESAIAKRLLPGNRTATDQLVHDWLRLFNLDRSAMAAVQVADVGAPTEKKEREHRPTRKASLSQEHNDVSMNEKKMAKEAEEGNKKAANADSGQNKGDKRLFNLDTKEVYEVFKHGAHYLREANKPEVQRTELNRIELSMPKKLVDTVMMLVNANLKMLLGDRARSFGLTMLRHVAVSNQLNGRREFSAAHVANALLIDQVNTEGLTLWLHLNKEEGGLPLTKTLEAQTELAPAQYQFKHLSFQEGLFAQHLLLLAADGWEGWATDDTAATFLNNPFMNNTCRIAAGHLGTLLAKRRPLWSFGGTEESHLTEVGLQALWLICEKNDKLASLNVSGNSVGQRNEDSVGLARMLSTSSALVSLNLSDNLLGDLKQYLRSFGRGLGSNKTLTQLDVSKNMLLPDGIKTVCNALRTCTAMKVLDVSYNSPGRETALPELLRGHPTLNSVGVIEKEPTTRSERTWWLDTRAKEAIGRALLDSPGTIQYLQCDVFSLREDTTTLKWISRAPCDAICLAGVVRANSTLKTLNIDGNGDLGDFERDEIGRALLSNTSGRLGFCSIYGLKEGMNPMHKVDLKDKEQIRSLRSFTLFCGLLRANQTMTSLELSSILPDHIPILAQALATNTTLSELKLVQQQKGSADALTVLPVQQLNGSIGKESIDLSEAGAPLPNDAEKKPTPMHRHACGVVGALLAVNQSVKYLKINPGPGAEGGGILEHLHRARKSTLRTLDLTGIGLGDRGGVRFFETLLAGQCSMLNTLCLGSNKLTSNAVGPLVVEVLRGESCNLTALDLNSNLIGGPVITQAIKFNKSLTQLDITGNPIEDDGLWTIGGLLLESDCTCHLRSIRTFAFDVTDEVSKHSETGQLETGAARLLFGVLKYNISVINLDLSGAGIETSAAFDLATAVSANSTLKALDLTNNPLSDPSKYEQPGTKKKENHRKSDENALSDTKGLHELAEAIRLAPSLAEVTLEGGKLPITSLKGANAKVKAIDLSRRNLSFLSCIFLGTLLETNTTITDLSLHSNELTPLGAKMVVERLQTSLKTLDLNNIMRVDDTRSRADKKAEKSGNLRASTTTPRTAEKEVPAEQLEELWAAVMKLGSLEKLTMDRDCLLELRPDPDAIPTLGQLMSLKTLSLANNKLTTMPEDLCLVRGLKVLSLHGNKLTELPISIGQLECLEKLDLKSNQLSVLPTSISQLTTLKTLDASDNKLVSLDPSICDLVAIEKFELKDNPLQRPPATIARQGILAIRRYFVELAASGETPSNGARLVLLGHGEAGKTSLQRGLRARAPRPSAVDDRTIQLDIYSLVLGEGSKQVVLSMWDLAGQAQYAAGLQPYIVDGSLYLLTVPALDVSTLNSLYADYLGRWLSYLEVGAPNAIVLPVLTKCDMLPGAEALLPHQRTQEAFKGLAEAQLAWMKESVDRHLEQQEGNSRLRIEPSTQCVSSVAGGDISLEAMRSRLDELVFSDPPALASIGQLIPRTWLLAITFLRALRDGRNPVEAARQMESANQSMETEKTVGRSYIRLDEAIAEYTTNFVPALKAASPDEQVLKDALQLLVNQGEIFASSGIIYLQPDYVTRLLKPLVDHRMGKKFLQVVQAKLADKSDLSDAERAATLVAAEVLASSGELREELLPIMWEPVGLSRDDFGGVALMLCESGVLFLAEHGDAGRRWVMPMRLREEQPVDAKQQWAEALEGDNAEVLGIAIRLGRFSPPGILERLMALCYGLGKYHKFWKRGAQIESHFEGHISQLLIELRQASSDLQGAEAEEAVKEGRVLAEEKSNPVFELTIEFCGDKSMRSRLYAVLMQVKGLAQTVLDDFEGLQTKTELCCPTCVVRVQTGQMEWAAAHQYKRRKEGEADEPQPDWTITRWPIDDVAKKTLRCERCAETVSLSAVPLSVGKIQGMSLILPTKVRSDFEVPEHKLVSDKLKLGKPLEASFGLSKLLGCEDGIDVEAMRHASEAVLIDEILRASTCEAEDEFGWTDLSWVHYITGKPVVRPDATEEDKAIQGNRQKPVPEPDSPFKAKLDAGREVTSLQHFATLPIVQAAGLTKAHVLALRMYTGSFGRKINTPLHNGCSVERPHPYPTAVTLILDAVRRLRIAQVDERKTAIAAAAEAEKASQAEKAELLKEGGQGDEERAAARAAEAAAAAALAERLSTNIYWRGVYGLAAIEFKQRGSCEVALLSLTKERAQAQQAAIAQHHECERAHQAEDLFEASARESARISSHRTGRLSHDGSQMGTPGSAGGGGRKLERQGSLADLHKGAAPPPELPILLFKVRIDRDSENVENVPTDISFLSAFPGETEAVFVPGCYLEWKRETTETIHGIESDGGDGQAKVIEVLPHLPSDVGRAGSAEGTKSTTTKGGR